MIACFLITISALIQLLLTMWYRRRMLAQPQPTPLPREHQHSTWIVMSLRGADPTLGDAMQSLLNQEYEDYRICAVVDNEQDPAAAVLQPIAARAAGRLVIRHLQKPHSGCTLKCSAIAEGVEHVLATDENVRYFVMVDADSNPPNNMLATLVGVLHGSPGIGLASGNQWFEPGDAGVGSVVRSLWYAGALFFSMLFENPWAGAYAMRASDIRDTGLIDVWRQSAVDDGPLKGLLSQHGLQCRSLPSMVMVNRESCSLGWVLRWMTRILTWSRIHEPAFWLTAFQMTYATTLIMAIFATLGVAIFDGNTFLVGCAALAIITSGILSVFAWITIRQSVIETAQTAGELKPVSASRFVIALLVVGVAQAVYAIACLRAMLSRSVSWRGVNYSVSGKKVLLQQYLPYRGDVNSTKSI